MQSSLSSNLNSFSCRGNCIQLIEAQFLTPESERHPCKVLGPRVSSMRPCVLMGASTDLRAEIVAMIIINSARTGGKRDPISCRRCRDTRNALSLCEQGHQGDADSGSCISSNARPGQAASSSSAAFFELVKTKTSFSALVFP